MTGKEESISSETGWDVDCVIGWAIKRKTIPSDMIDEIPITVIIERCRVFIY
jgi:hypothetical protein